MVKDLVLFISSLVGVIESSSMMSDNEIVVSPDDRKVGSADIELSPLHFASTFSEIEATKSHTYAQKKGLVCIRSCKISLIV